MELFVILRFVIPYPVILNEVKDLCVDFLRSTVRKNISSVRAPLQELWELSRCEKGRGSQP